MGNTTPNKTFSPILQLSKDYTTSAIEYAGRGNTILGIREAGKTYTAMKAAEQLLDAGIPIIVYDPIGVWKNLKIGLNKHKGYPIVVAGANGCDINLNTSNAADIVRAAMKENVSLVIDLYSPELINKAKWITIVQETIDLLMYENEPYGMRHIFLEEAAEFIPQRVQPQHARVYASIERLARMGRNACLGYTLINQRAEEVNKAILEICALTLLHKQVGKNSLKSIQSWLEILQIDNYAEIIKSLPRLEAGHCWAIGHSEKPKLIAISSKNTFHPNPKNRQQGTIKTATADVSSFVKKMNRQLAVSTVVAEKQAPGKADHWRKFGMSPDEAQKKINDLLSRLNNAEQEISKYKDLYQKSKHNMSCLLEKLNDLAFAHNTDFSSAENESRQNKSKYPVTGTAAEINSSKMPARAIETASRKTSSAGGADRMLKAVAMFYPHSISRIRMATIAGLSSKSGTFNTYISTLRKEELITNHGNSFHITDKGLKKAGNVDPLPTEPAQLINMWCELIGPNAGAARMLRCLYTTYPVGLDRKELADLVGISATSGSFNTYLSTLKRNELIEVASKKIKASSNLFNNSTH